MNDKEFEQWLPERIAEEDIDKQQLMQMLSIDKDLQANAPEGCVVIGKSELVSLLKFAHAMMKRENGSSTKASKAYIEERTDPESKKRKLTPRERTVGRSYDYWQMSLEKQIVEDIQLGYLNVDLRS